MLMPLEEGERAREILFNPVIIIMMCLCVCHQAEQRSSASGAHLKNSTVCLQQVSIFIRLEIVILILDF